MLNSPDVVVHLVKGRVAWVSPSVVTVLGGNVHDWLAQPVCALVHPDDHGVVTDMERCLEFGESAIGRLRVRDANGECRWLEVHAQQIVDRQGRANGLVASCRPADDAVRAEAALRRLATSDALTGLPNRREVQERLSRSLAASGAGGAPSATVAALFCDVDHFKMVNDTYGHAVGDAVLRVLADRLQAVVRETDVVARIGGDELLVLLEGVADITEANRLATEIGTVAALPMVVMGRPVQVTLSIGVTMMSPTDGMETLLERADRAMYRAKQHGRNRVVMIPASAADSVHADMSAAL